MSLLILLLSLKFGDDAQVSLTSSGEESASSRRS